MSPRSIQLAFEIVRSSVNSKERDTSVLIKVAGLRGQDALPEWSAGVICADACVQAVMSFDLGCPVGDAQWAPYSATVFAAVGDDGRVQVSVALQISCLPFQFEWGTLNTQKCELVPL